MNIEALDLNLLLAFDALYEERNVSRAARRIGISQPAMSNALARLRVALNDPLFERTGRGIRPSTRAERLGPAVRSGIAQLRRALQPDPRFDPRSSQRLFRLALSDYAEYRILPALVSALGQEAPQARLQVRRLDALFSVPEADLRHGAIDLAIGFFPDARSLEEGTAAETLIEEQNAVVFRRDHPLSHGPLTLERFAEASHAAVIFRAEPWGLIDQELASRGLRRRLQYASPHFLAVCEILQQTDLIATLPAALGRRVPGLITRSVPLELPTFTTRVVWRDHDDESLTWLRHRLRLVADSIGGFSAKPKLRRFYP
ncbi:MAG: LysR family transcriptional regulator [Bryobacteraceae bacterium]|nr:LysR family transcriptional regulator [Bryobacteraceae bacterium]